MVWRDVQIFCILDKIKWFCFGRFFSIGNDIKMNTWEHSLLGQRKFGGRPEDYHSIHKFIDSSKLFCYHLKHRLLLHNLYGVELAISLFGDAIKNADGAIVMVRDIAVEHVREDLDGKIPTLAEWLEEDKSEFPFEVPDLGDEKLNSFIWKPYLRSGHKAALNITCSDFGIFLTELFYGPEAALKLRSKIKADYKVSSFLERFTLTKSWQYSPMKEELEWLKNQNKSK